MTSTIKYEKVEKTLDVLFDSNKENIFGLTQAIVVMHKSTIVYENYGSEIDANTPLLSWSMAKSITQAIFEIAVKDNLIDRNQKPVVDIWKDPLDPRHKITFHDLLTMRSGLEFIEDYVDDKISHCLEMLFGSGADDVGNYAANLPLIHKIGSHYNYSSGTTNIISLALKNALGGTQIEFEKYIQAKLFEPIGMKAEPRYDASGTWVGSTYVYATARDFLKFGKLYLENGVCDGSIIIPEIGIASAKKGVSFDESENMFHSQHWWVSNNKYKLFGALGYEGQHILVAPQLELVLVRLGKTPSEKKMALRNQLFTAIDLVAELF